MEYRADHRLPSRAHANGERGARSKAEGSTYIALVSITCEAAINKYYLSPNARPVDVHGYLVIGRSDDSGNLKGFLRKCGRKYDQRRAIHSDHYPDAELHALKDLPISE